MSPVMREDLKYGKNLLEEDDEQR